MGAPKLSELSRDECFRLLASVPVGRVGVSIDAIPVVVPVNFALMDGDIVFRTVQGTEFHVVAAGAVVAFEIDGHEPDGGHGWRVLVQASRGFSPTTPSYEHARELTGEPWAVDGAADRIVCITSIVVTGRRFERISPSHDETLPQEWPRGAL